MGNTPSRNAAPAVIACLDASASTGASSSVSAPTGDDDGDSSGCSRPFKRSPNLDPALSRISGSSKHKLLSNMTGKPSKSSFRDDLDRDIAAGLAVSLSKPVNTPAWVAGTSPSHAKPKQKLPEPGSSADSASSIISTEKAGQTSSVSTVSSRDSVFVFPDRSAKPQTAEPSEHSEHSESVDSNDSASSDTLTGLQSPDLELNEGEVLFAAKRYRPGFVRRRIATEKPPALSPEDSPTLKSSPPSSGDLYASRLPEPAIPLARNAKTPQAAPQTAPQTAPRNAPLGLTVDIDSVIDRLLDVGLSGTSSDRMVVKPHEMSVICHQARNIFLAQPTLLELAAPAKVVGDIHGQFHDLIRIFKLCGFPPKANYLFLGDYVDRGYKSLETILLLLCFKIKHPENFFMLRGNHESASVTKVYGFFDECKRRCSTKTWKMFVDVFNALPICAVISGKIFCVHGGLSPSLLHLDDVRRINRPTDVPDTGLLSDLLWSDPDGEVPEWGDNDRGVSYCFGKVIVSRFCRQFNIDLICRAHMVVEDGYEFFSRRKLVTLFSAPNYCGEFDNWGAVMSVNKDLLCSFELLKPMDHHTLRKTMRNLRPQIRKLMARDEKSG